MSRGNDIKGRGEAGGKPGHLTGSPGFGEITTKRKIYWGDKTRIAKWMILGEVWKLVVSSLFLRTIRPQNKPNKSTLELA